MTQVQVDFSEQEMEVVWANFTKDTIARDIKRMATIEDDEFGEGQLELIDIFSSHWHNFQSLRQAEENDEDLSPIQQEVYVALVEDILLPILDKMNRWGCTQWVEENEFSYEL